MPKRVRRRRLVVLASNDDEASTLATTTPERRAQDEPLIRLLACTGANVTRIDELYTFAPEHTAVFNAIAASVTANADLSAYDRERLVNSVQAWAFVAITSTWTSIEEPPRDARDLLRYYVQKRVPTLTSIALE